MPAVASLPACVFYNEIKRRSTGAGAIASPDALRGRCRVTGARALLNMLRAAGVDRVFGNPGTTELPLLDELVTFNGIHYHLVLQESVATGMADGYAQASGRVGVLGLHVTGGAGNAIGLLYNAARAGTPLLVLSGQQDTRLSLQEPFLYSDMVRWMRPHVKWSYEVVHPRDLPRALRRAISEALAPPTGPVFLAVPLDVLRADAVPVEDAVPHYLPTGYPGPEALAPVSATLRQASNPLIVAGDRVAHAGAEGELLAFAEVTRWPVALEPYPGRFIFPNCHPLAGGPLPRFAAALRERLAPHDVVLAIGFTPFEHFLYDGVDPIPAGTRIIHLDVAPAFIGRNHPVAAGAAGDLRALLHVLVEGAGTGRGTRRTGFPGDRPQTDWAVRDTDSRAVERIVSGPYEAVADGVAAALRDEDVLVEEAISGRVAVLDRIPRSLTGTFFGQKGGTIGWGLPAALGVKIARPDRRVVLVVGDGALLMAAQGLWTAAQEEIAVAIVVLNNRGYGILKQGLASLAGDAVRHGIYPGTDISGVDLVALARSFGVTGERIEGDGRPRSADVTAALGRALAARAPYLIDVVLDIPVRPLV